MIDFLLLLICTFLLSAIIKKKSIVFKISNSVLFVTFLFVILFSTNNTFISNLVSNLVGEDRYLIIKSALTSPVLFSYAANGVWLVYKVFLILFVAFYGSYIFVNHIVKVLMPVNYELIGTESFDKKENTQYVNNYCNNKLFLCFKRLLD